MMQAIIDKLTSSQPIIMGIINVTPDSFSENGENFNVSNAVDAAKKLIDHGADIIDIGGESTRPGASPVSARQEIQRVEPVFKALQDAGVPLSIDTRNAQTMQAALDCGASIINDVTALRGDKDSIHVAKHSGAFICLMHMQGSPQTMQANPVYDDVIRDVYDFFKERIKFCEKNGIEKHRLFLDPGIGFGKTLSHNLELFRCLEKFQDLDLPLLIGASRKSFIHKACLQVCGDLDVDNRLPGSLSACVIAYMKGARIFRVHDVADTRQALHLAYLIQKS